MKKPLILLGGIILSVNLISCGSGIKTHVKGGGLQILGQKMNIPRTG